MSKNKNGKHHPKASFMDRVLTGVFVALIEVGIDKYPNVCFAVSFLIAVRCKDEFTSLCACASASACMCVCLTSEKKKVE